MSCYVLILGYTTSMHEMTDDKIREKVRAWLKDNKYTQEKLATKLGLKGQSLRAQMSKKPISAKTKLALMNLIPQIFSNEHQELEDLPFVENLGKMFITLEPNIQDLVHQEAYRLGLTVTAYCSLAVEYAASNEEMRTEITSLHVSKRKVIPSTQTPPRPSLSEKEMLRAAIRCIRRLLPKGKIINLLDW